MTLHCARTNKISQYTTKCQKILLLMSVLKSFVKNNEQLPPINISNLLLFHIIIPSVKYLKIIINFSVSFPENTSIENVRKNGRGLE